jgi:hypothetical protein
MAPGPTRRSSRLQARARRVEDENALLYSESGLLPELWCMVFTFFVVDAGDDDDDDDAKAEAARTVHAVCKKYGARWGPVARLHSGQIKLALQGGIECLIATAAYSRNKRSTGLHHSWASPVLPNKDLALPLKNKGLGPLSDLSIEHYIYSEYLDPFDPDRTEHMDLDHLSYYSALLPAFSAALRHFGFTDVQQVQQRVASAHIVMEHLWHFGCMRKEAGQGHKDSGFQKWVELKNMLYDRIELPGDYNEHFSLYLPFKRIDDTWALLVNYHRGNHENVQLDWYQLVERL